MCWNASTVAMKGCFRFCLMFLYCCMFVWIFFSAAFSAYTLTVLNGLMQSWKDAEGEAGPTLLVSPIPQRNRFPPLHRGVARVGGAGRIRRHLLKGGKLAKIVKKNHMKFHMFASAIKTKSYSQRDRRLYWVFDCVRFDFPKPKTIGRQIWPPHQAAKGPATPLSLQASWLCKTVWKVH